MRTHKKLFALVCMLVSVLFMLSACAQPAQPTTPSEDGAAAAQDAPEQPADSDPATASEDLPKFKIGLIAYTNAGLWWDRIYDAVKTTAEALGCEVVTAAGDVPDAAIAAVENLCASGVDAIIDLATAGVTPRLVEICAANGVYLGGCYNDCTMDEGYDAIAQNEYWVGDVYTDEHATSYAIAKDMIDNGAKNMIVFGLPPGVSTSFDLRASGAMEAAAEAGINAAEVRSFALPEIANTFLTQYPETDAVFCCLGATTYITNPIMSAGYANKLQVVTYDDEVDTVGAFEAGLLTHATEGGNAQAQVVFALVYNALTGNPVRNADGTAAHINLPYCLMKSADEYKVFLNASTGGNMPYTVDDVKAMIKTFNPDASVESIQAVTSQFSIEDLAKRHP